MVEPQPSNIREGADIDDEPAPAAPASAEDRKAAAALSSLDARGDEDGGKKSEADQKALGEAMSRLEILGGGAKPAGPAAAEEKKKNGGEVERKRIKVDQADVGLLVEELELSKAKATELLKMHEGDAVRAMRAFIKVGA